MNSTSSRWAFNVTQFTSLNNLNNRLKKSTPRLKNVTNFKIQSYSESINKYIPLSIKLSNKTINFFAYHIHYFETSAAGNRMERNYSLIIYKVKGRGTIHAIIDKNSGSLPLLREIFGFADKNEIRFDPLHNINNYLLLWIVNRVYNNKKTLIRPHKVGRFN